MCIVCATCGCECVCVRLKCVCVCVGRCVRCRCVWLKVCVVYQVGLNWEEGCKTYSCTDRNRANSYAVSP